MKGVRKIAVDQLVNYLATDPIKKMPKIVSLAKKLDPKHQYDFYIDGIYNALMDEDGNWHKFTIDLFKDTIFTLVETVWLKKFQADNPIKTKTGKLGSFDLKTIIEIKA